MPPLALVKHFTIASRILCHNRFRFALGKAFLRETGRVDGVGDDFVFVLRELAEPIQQHDRRLVDFTLVIIILRIEPREFQQRSHRFLEFQHGEITVVTDRWKWNRRHPFANQFPGTVLALFQHVSTSPHILFNGLEIQCFRLGRLYHSGILGGSYRLNNREKEES